MIAAWLALSALAEEPALTPVAPVVAREPDVVRGWYLWRSGQDAAAYTLARTLHDARQRSLDPQDLDVHEFYIAMATAMGAGASIEAEYREWWGEDPADPVRRVALAFAVTYRHAEVGTWCDDVTSLVGKVHDGLPHYFATVVDRERERRCTGATGHADAEFGRLAKVPGQPGWAEGVLARAEASYIKEDLPEMLEAVWTAHPDTVDRAGALWGERVAGPGKAAAKRAASKALKAAAESTDPVLVHAAVLGYVGSGDEKSAADARARLLAADPSAKADVVRSMADLHDPAAYAEIDLCSRSADFAEALACIAKLPLEPLSGDAEPGPRAIAAYAWYQRRLLAEALSRPDEAYAAARAAYQADPSVRFHARTFARMVADHHLDAPDDVALALTASESLKDRLPAAFVAGGGMDTVPEAQRTALAREIDVRGRLLRAAGRADEAIVAFGQLRRLEPTARHQILYGLALASAGRADEAGLELAYGLAVEVADTRLITEGRDALRPIATGWVPDGVRGMIDAAKRPIGDEAPPHPLVGKKLTDEALLPTPPAPPADPKAKPPVPGTRVIATWASWSQPSVDSLERLATITQKYADKGVTAVVLGVDGAEVPFPRDPPPAGSTAPAPTEPPLAIAHRWVGPSAMRALQSVALPTVVVVDGKGTVVAVASPYDRGSLALETALDGLLPKP